MPPGFSKPRAALAALAPEAFSDADEPSTNGLSAAEFPAVAGFMATPDSEAHERSGKTKAIKGKVVRWRR
jgi:hypothetical protein